MCGWDVGSGRREGGSWQEVGGEYWERRGGRELDERGGKSEWGGERREE